MKVCAKTSRRRRSAAPAAPETDGIAAPGCPDKTASFRLTGAAALPDGPQFMTGRTIAHSREPA